MVRMLAAIALSLSVSTESFRLAQQASKQSDETCGCSETGVVDGIDTGKAGCAEHFGQRFGYICYIANGAECEGARISRRTGVYWRSCRAEHLTDEAKGYVEEAMEELDVDNLRTTIEIARSKGVDAETIARAEARVEQQVEMIAARDELMEALEAFDADRLRAALEAAEELELDEYLSEDTLDRSVERFEFLQRRQESEEALRAAVTESDLPDLETKLRIAQTNHVSREAIELAQDRVRELNRLIAVAMDELEEAMLTRDAARITEAQDNAQALHAIDSSAATQVENRLAHLISMEEATEELRLAIEGLSLRDLQAKLARARELDSYPDVLRQGQNRVAALTQMNADALEAVIAATAGHNAKALMDAIAHAQTLDTGVDHAEEIATATARLQNLAQKDVAQASLEAAMETVDLETIQEILTNAEDLGVDSAVLEQARQRISEIAQMRVDARAALESAVEGDELEVLDAALENAQRLSATDDALTGRADARLDALIRRQDAKDDLLAAIAALDLANLQAKITAAQGEGVDEPTLHEGASRVRELEQLMQRAERNLQQDTVGGDYEKLRDSIAEAASYNGAVTEEQLELARARLAELAEVYHRTQDLINAFDTKSMGHIQHMLRRCRDAGCSQQVLNDGEAAASRLRVRMAHAESNMIRLTYEGTDAQELRDAIAEVRLLNAAAHYRIKNAEDHLQELEAEAAEAAEAA